MSAPAAEGDAVGARPRLARRVLGHVLLALFVTWLAGSAVTLGVANFYTRQAFDRALLDDAYSVAANVRAAGSGADARLELTLTPREVGAVLFDQAESIYFAVLRPDGTLVEGHPGLRTPPLDAGRSSQFFDTVYQGRELRAVRLARELPLPFEVVMGQTTHSRQALLERLLLFTTLPQIALLLLLAGWLRHVVARDLAPLADLQQALDQRDAQDLAPLPAAAGTREIDRLALAVNALLARIATSVRAQREFSGNVAHELRTPLAGIRAQVGYALAHPDDPAVWREQLQGIAESEARASRRIDQLLLLSIGEEARARLELTQLPLDELVRDTLLRWLPRAQAQGVDLGAAGLDQHVPVRGNAGLVEGLLDNLIDNALRYRAADRPAVTVALAPLAGGAVRLSVTDNGTGLSAGEAARLLRRGMQGEQGQRLGLGAGLGLAIVVRYAELLGARFAIGPAASGRGLCASVDFTVEENRGAPAPSAPDFQ